MDPVTGNGISSNPFYLAAQPRAPRSRVWAMGLRNPFRFTVKPGSGSTNPSAGDIGELFIGEVGWNIYDEINIIKEPASNCGWPLFEGMASLVDYTNLNTANGDEPNPLWNTAGCTGAAKQFFLFKELMKQATADNNDTVYNPCNGAAPIISGSSNRFFHRRPVIDWQHGSNGTRVPLFSGNNATFAQIGTAASGVDGTPFQGICSIGGLWYTGSLFPANFRNTYIQGDMGDFNKGWMKSFSIDYTDVVQKVQNIASGFAAIVCMVENPLDGTVVYADIGNGTVKRITYGGNQYPVVKATSDIIYGPSALNVSFTGSNSYDPEGGRLTYSWNFGDGSPVSTSADISHPFTAPAGTPKKYTVILTVKDSVNFTAVDSIIISVNNTPPNVAITSPVPNSTYRPGVDTTYAFRATVSDAEHNASQLKYEWQKILRHNFHEHPGPIDTTRNTSGIIARIGCNGETYYWVIRLKVTDAAGPFGC
ncbi:MAG: PKD domain-containing protein [Bacteroidota bacterium]